jgi:hypothetical protein
MRKSWLVFLLVLVVLSNLNFYPLVAQSAIADSGDTTTTNTLKGSVPPLTKSAADGGAMDGNAMLHGLIVNFSLSASKKASLDALVHDQQNPASPQYHRWLTQAQFATQFGPTPQTLEAVSSWLHSQGFTIDHVADSGNAIHFSGTVRQAQEAFETEIHKYTVNGESHFANETDLKVPYQFSGLISSIHGLDDFRPHPEYVRKPAPASTAENPLFTSGQTGAHSLSPGDIATIYDIAPLYNSGTTGTGQTIGIVGQTDIVVTDIQDFRSAAGLPAITPTVFLIPGSADPGIRYTTDLTEADIDLEWSGAIAKNAAIVFVNSTDALTSLQYAIQNKINGIQLPILSSSYGNCEFFIGSSTIASDEAIYEQANAQGQTIVSAAGDDGAADCSGDSLFGVLGLQVDYPSSSAYVTGVGGTEFDEGNSLGSTQYWSANGGTDVVSSAISYIPEMAWDDTPNENDATILKSLSAGGGGKSTQFSKPAWQTGVPGIPADNARDVPDISFSASAVHDPYLFCTQIQLTNTTTYTASCTNGFRDSNGSLQEVGGTSVAAPIFAGVVALIEQQGGSAQGNVNPLLYSLASTPSTYASAFHDITVGSNTVPCELGTLDCQSNGTLGYSAGTGYDQASGLGSLDIANFAKAVSGTSSKAIPSTSITIFPSAPAVGQNATITASITVTSGSTPPTGTVSFSVDGDSIQSGVPLSNDAASVTYAFATSGSHTVSISYSGDDNYNPVNNSTTVNIGTSSPIAATTTTVTANPGSVAISGSVTLSATVTSQAGGTLPGTVAFTLGNTNLGSANVAAGTSGSGYASLTIFANSNIGFAVGVNTITATYSGGSQYAQSSSTTTVTVTNGTASNSGFTLTAGNITIPTSSPGYFGSSTITVTSTGGYSGTVNLTSTSTDNVNAYYTINPPWVTVSSGGNGSTTITVNTISGDSRKGPTSNYRHANTTAAVVGGSATLAGLFLFGLGGHRRRKWSILATALAVAILGSCMGCGTNTSNSGASQPGTYTITVTGTDSLNSSITNSTTFTLTIQ